jgi:LacI family transcriptional regulator
LINQDGIFYSFVMVNKSTITIKDVAKAAGVSTQTVSRVLNQRPDVSPETREHVERIIHEMGYAPNIIARSLSSGKSSTLGVVGFGLEYYGPARVLTGIEKQAAKDGLSMMLTLLEHFDRESVERTLTHFIAQQVAGIIWAIPGFADSLEIVEKAAEGLTIPIVFLNRPTIENQVVVSVDNRSGARLAVEHLVQQGYRNIGTITGPLNWWEAQERLVGWREVIAEEGKPIPDQLIFEGDWGVESGDCGFEALFSANPDLDAIFVSNDQMALGVIQAANRNGLAIPGDLGIAGFDDIPEAKFFFPALTTIHQPTNQLGALAVKRLYNLIRAVDLRGTETIELEDRIMPELIIRKSSIHN